MKIFYPYYYKKFKCIASRCEDTCCAGWEIVVDSDSCRKYYKLKNDFGSLIRSKMTADDDGDIIFKNQNNRCPFLNNDNLCDIYLNAGEDYLCRTCDMFPRFENIFGGTKEIGLGLACPEAARIILNSEDKFSLVESSDNETVQINETDPELYFSVLNFRKKVFEILRNEDCDFKTKLAVILSYAEAFQKRIDEGDFSFADYPKQSDNLNYNFLKSEICTSYLKRLEILTERWQNILDSFPPKNNIEPDFKNNGNLYRKIAEYYIYRYLLTAVYDEDVLSKVKLCVFSCYCINYICTSEKAESPSEIADVAHLYSKEAEYSAENLSLLYTLLKE